MKMQDSITDENNGAKIEKLYLKNCVKPVSLSHINEKLPCINIVSVVAFIILPTSKL
jgi:hypothetical protein